jgi:hypothetical protein
MLLRVVPQRANLATLWQRDVRHSLHGFSSPYFEIYGKHSIVTA